MTVLKVIKQLMSWSRLLRHDLETVFLKSLSWFKPAVYQSLGKNIYNRLTRLAKRTIKYATDGLKHDTYCIAHV